MNGYEVCLGHIGSAVKLFQVLKNVGWLVTSSIWGLSPLLKKLRFPVSYFTYVSEIVTYCVSASTYQTVDPCDRGISPDHIHSHLPVSRQLHNLFAGFLGCSG